MKRFSLIVLAIIAVIVTTIPANAWTHGFAIVGNWILTSGIWADTGVWKDTSVWID